MLELSRESRYVRLFCWAWETSPESLDLCVLFWGTLFLPISSFKGTIFKTIPRFIIPFFGLAVLNFFWGIKAISILWASFALIAILGGIWAMSEKRRELTYDGIHTISTTTGSAFHWIRSRRWALVPLAIIFFPITLIVLVIWTNGWLLDWHFDRQHSRATKNAKTETKSEPKKPSALRVGISRSYHNLKDRTCDIIVIKD